MLNYVKLGQYKSYFTQQTIEFATPNRLQGQLGLTILVGPNNSGKSTPLNCIVDLLDNQKTLTVEQSARHVNARAFLRVSGKTSSGGRPIDFSVEAHLEKNEAYQVKTVLYNNIIAPMSSINRKFFKYIPSRRPWSDRFSQSSSMDYDQFEANAKIQRKNSDTQLGQILQTIATDPTHKAEYSKLVRQVLPSMIDWGLDRIGGTDYVTYKTSTGATHFMSELGDGFSNIFRIAATIYFSKPNDTIALDEPELSLHPQAQKRLFGLLSETSKDRQVIVATHSPYFISWDSLSKGAHLYRIAKRDSGRTSVQRLSTETVSRLLSITQKDIKNRKLYDTVAKEVFFQDEVVFLEGQEDVHILEAYLEQEGQKSLPFFGYGSGGASHIISWLRMAKELGLRAAAIYDDDVSHLADVASEEFSATPSVSIFNLGRDDIRDKYLRDGNCNTTGRCKETTEILKEGYFDKRWVVKPTGKVEIDDLLNKVREHLKR